MFCCSCTIQVSQRGSLTYNDNVSQREIVSCYLQSHAYYAMHIIYSLYCSRTWIRSAVRTVAAAREGSMLVQCAHREEQVDRDVPRLHYAAPGALARPTFVLSVETCRNGSDNARSMMVRRLYTCELEV